MSVRPSTLTAAEHVAVNAIIAGLPRMPDNDLDDVAMILAAYRQRRATRRPVAAAA